jgi:hypothetical protein
MHFATPSPINSVINPPRVTTFSCTCTINHTRLSNNDLFAIWKKCKIKQINYHFTCADALCREKTWQRTDAISAMYKLTLTKLQFQLILTLDSSTAWCEAGGSEKMVEVLSLESLKLRCWTGNGDTGCTRLGNKSLCSSFLANCTSTVTPACCIALSSR